ncbi:hypothetical protein [Pseudonocardia humida]|uniref:Uncharacterized protein n=1 Tax=Pseudonocardia humida TaxID=2800819 RepID=A0ABT1A2L4_9PSEU|nr:hypothetical protein [Pseudonocardia humida]MCO1657251.1 hypothetical protein [Pseudonocardia humida]
MSAVSRFRLFGRPPESTPAPAPPRWSPTSAGPPPPPPGGPATGMFPAAGPGTGLFPAVSRPAGSDGAAAGPFGGPPPPARTPSAPRRRYPGDPPTNPFGYPPVAGPAAGSRTGAGPGGPVPYPDRADATALAGAFAADYLSWDEDDPARRGRVLADYLPATGTDPTRLGWSGRGRQRAEFVLPGRVRPDGEGRVLVDVRVRVTPYRPVGAERAAGAPEHDAPAEVGGVPAAAPAPTAPGWRGMASCWVRLTVPVVLDGDRLLVDAWEELIGADLPLPGAAPARPAPAPEDHALDDDEPPAEPTSGTTTAVAAEPTAGATR